MMPVNSLLLSAFCAISLLPAPRTTEPPVLSVSLLPAAVEFRIEADDAPFIGAVIGSLSPTVENYLVGLPPLLADFVVINVGCRRLCRESKTPSSCSSAKSFT